MSDHCNDGLARMLDYIRALPEQLRAAADLPGRDGLRPLPRRPRQVLLCGMGGSAIAGDLVRPLLAAAGLPLWVQRDYGLPPWVDADTLIVASSYSGRTEETLDALAEVERRGCPWLAITSGGSLLDRARAADGASNPVGALVLPGGLPPRASLGFGLGALLWGLHGLGLIPSPSADIAAAAAVLDDGNRLYGPDREPPENPAAALAVGGRDRFLVIYSASPEAHGAGQRLKAQINENAKGPAYEIAFPELNHNDIVGWQLPRSRRDEYLLLVLRSADEQARTSRRVTITREILADQFAAAHEVWARGDVPLARILSLVQFGDYLSWHLARVRGIDPVPVTRIEILKERLQKGSSA